MAGVISHTISAGSTAARVGLSCVEATCSPPEACTDTVIATKFTALQAITHDARARESMPTFRPGDGFNSSHHGSDASTTQTPRRPPRPKALLEGVFITLRTT